MKGDAAVRASASGGRWLLFSALGTLIALGGLGVIIARPSTASSLATLDVLEESVEVRLAGQTEFSTAGSGDALAEGSVVRTDRTGLAAISYEDGSLTRIGPVSTYELTTLATHKGKREIVGRLDAGQTFHRVTKASGSGSRFEVQTSNAVAAVRGTAFAVQCLTPDVCEVGVTEGTVAVRTPDGQEVAVEAGHKVAVDNDGNLGDLQLLLQSDPWIERNADIDNVGPESGTDSAEPANERIGLAVADEPEESEPDEEAPPAAQPRQSERQPEQKQETTPTSAAAGTTTTVAQNNLDFTPEPQPHPDRIDGSEGTPPTTPTTEPESEPESTSTTRRAERSTTTTAAVTTTTTAPPPTTTTTTTQTTPQGTTSTTSELEANDPPPTTTTTSAPTTTSTAAETTTSTSTSTTTTAPSTTTSSTTTSTTTSTSTSTTSSTTTSTTTPACPGNQVPDGQGGCRPECPSGGPPPCGNGGGPGSRSAQKGAQPRWMSLSRSAWTSG